MRVKVTQEHINKGERISCSRCPVALAIADITNVVVSVTTTCFYRLKKTRQDRFHLRKKVDMPLEVRKFVRRFDSYQPVEPFEFDLDVE